MRAWGAGRGGTARGGAGAARASPPSHSRPLLPPQVILTRDIPGLGSEGQLRAVPVGYFRNFLQPQALAAPATEGILERIRLQREAEERAKLEEKAKAQAMVRGGVVAWGGWGVRGRTSVWTGLGRTGGGRWPAWCGAARFPRPRGRSQATALATIGKFVLKKKVGEKDQIFGSVTAQDVVDAIKMQTGRELDRRTLALPEVKSLGTYDASIKLHPEVTGFFKVRCVCGGGGGGGGAGRQGARARWARPPPRAATEPWLPTRAAPPHPCPLQLVIQKDTASS